MGLFPKPPIFKPHLPDVICTSCHKSSNDLTRDFGLRCGSMVGEGSIFVHPESGSKFETKLKDRKTPQTIFPIIRNRSWRGRKDKGGGGGSMSTKVVCGRVVCVWENCDAWGWKSCVQRSCVWGSCEIVVYECERVVCEKVACKSVVCNVGYRLVWGGPPLTNFGYRTVWKKQGTGYAIRWNQKKW